MGCLMGWDGMGCDMSSSGAGHVMGVFFSFTPGFYCALCLGTVVCVWAWVYMYCLVYGYGYGIDKNCILLFFFFSF